MMGCAASIDRSKANTTPSERSAPPADVVQATNRRSNLADIGIQPALRPRPSKARGIENTSIPRLAFVLSLRGIQLARLFLPDLR